MLKILDAGKILSLKMNRSLNNKDDVALNELWRAVLHSREPIASL